MLASGVLVGCSSQDDLADSVTQREIVVSVEIPGGITPASLEAGLQPPALVQLGDVKKGRSSQVDFSNDPVYPIHWGTEPLRNHIASSGRRADATANRFASVPLGSRRIRTESYEANEVHLHRSSAEPSPAVSLILETGPPTDESGSTPLHPPELHEPIRNESTTVEGSLDGRSASRVERIPTPSNVAESNVAESNVAESNVAESAEEMMLQDASRPIAHIAANPSAPQRPLGDSVAFNAANNLTADGPSSLDDGPEDYNDWPKPDTVLFITGDQHGYIEPCGCTGLDKQKGGVARRFTFLRQLKDDLGWNVVPIDVGNQIRRVGQQASIKFNWSNEALSKMGYQAIGLGPEDLRMGVGELISIVWADDPDAASYQSANVELLGDASLLAKSRIIRHGRRMIGVTNVVDPKKVAQNSGGDVTVKDPAEALKPVLEKFAEEPTNFNVLTFYGSEESAKELVKEVPGFDLVVVSGNYGEPTYRPQKIEGSKTKMILTGNKGMYVGLIGLFGPEPFRYSRVALTHEFEDAPEMRDVMKQYQEQLRDVGLADLGLRPIPHPSGAKYVGTEKCGSCHTKAYDVWVNTGHAYATDSIVEPPQNRGDVPRHFDPECISCHVTGWNPQGYYPYETGYLSLENSKHLHGNGCENCHGPGAEHSAAELEGSGVNDKRKMELRASMQLPLSKAKEQCMKCHDLDNSPDFHDEGAFENDYWPSVEHEGMD